MHQYVITLPGDGTRVEFDAVTWAGLVQAMAGAEMLKRSPVSPSGPPAIPGATWRVILDAVTRGADAPPSGETDLDTADAAVVAAKRHVLERGRRGAAPEVVSDEHWRTFELWQVADTARRTSHDDSQLGISTHKLTGSTTWVVTREECTGALDVWGQVDLGTASDAADAGGPAWPAWLELLEVAARHDGFTVRTYPTRSLD